MIRTYELSHESKTPLYVQLYEAIRADILSGSLPGGEKLPSKRALAEHLSLSKITVETAYAQLLEDFDCTHDELAREDGLYRRFLTGREKAVGWKL